jgi:AcrR family transcriptional regulator
VPRDGRRAGGPAGRRAGGFHTVLYGGVARPSPRRPLGRDDWTGAALEALAEGGVGAVAVERLTKRVGATRGSFYWHFKDRDDLIEAALERWERENTTDLIPAAETVADPVERLRNLFREVYERPADRIEIALAAATDDPRVRAVRARVTRARLEFLRRILAEIGLPAADAADRAWLAYAFYVGHHLLGDDTELRDVRPASLDRTVELLTSGTGPERQPGTAGDGRTRVR